MRTDQIMRIVDKILAPLRRRVMLMIGRAVLTAVNDSTKVQQSQVTLSADEVADDLERFQEYGFTSVPYAQAEGVVVFVAGNRAHGVIIATDDRRYRPINLAAGDVALYNDVGIRVFLEKSTDFVHLGAKAADDFLAKKTEANANDTELYDRMKDHVHPTGWGPSGVTTTAVGAMADVGTTKVKAT